MQSTVFLCAFFNHFLAREYSSYRGKLLESVPRRVSGWKIGQYSIYQGKKNNSEDFKLDHYTSFRKKMWLRRARVTTRSRINKTIRGRRMSEKNPNAQCDVDLRVILVCVQFPFVGVVQSAERNAVGAMSPLCSLLCSSSLITNPLSTHELLLTLKSSWHFALLQPLIC